MIKRIIKKIKSIFKRKKNLSLERSTAKSRNVDLFDLKKHNNVCSCCKEELNGRTSKRDEEGNYYIVCEKCNYVNKLKDGIVIYCPQNIEEAMKAASLFAIQPHCKMTLDDKNYNF